MIAALLVAAFVKIALPGIMEDYYGDFYNEEDEIVLEVTPEFTAANIMTIEEVGRTKIEDGDGLIVDFKFTNTGDDEIWYFNFTTRYYDKKGKILGEHGGEYSGKLGPGKFAYVTDSPDFEQKEKYGEIDAVAVTQYYYCTGNHSYTLYLRTNDFTSDSGIADLHNTANIEEADIVSISLGDAMTLKDGVYNLDVTATNNGKQPFIELAAEIEFYDEDGNSIGTERYGLSDLPEAGETVKTTVSYWSDYADQVKSYEVISYSYEFAENDQYGYNYYTIYKNINCAEATAWD